MYDEESFNNNKVFTKPYYEKKCGQEMVRKFKNITGTKNKFEITQ